MMLHTEEIQGTKYISETCALFTSGARTDKAPDSNKITVHGVLKGAGFMWVGTGGVLGKLQEP